MTEETMKRTCVLAALATCTGLASCSSQGAGVGELKTASGVAEQRVSPVRFSWHSEGPSVTKGTKSATVPGRGYFQGKYLQIASRTDVIDATPYFQGAWYPGWGTWDGWGGTYADDFVINYSGKVIAVLRSDRGESLRCRFRLAEPTSGPAGGGIGECEFSNGDKVDNVVLESR